MKSDVYNASKYASRIILTTYQHWLKKTSWGRLGAVWKHYITWSGVDPDYPRHDATGYNELNDTCPFGMAHNDNILRFMLHNILLSSTQDVWDCFQHIFVYKVLDIFAVYSNRFRRPEGYAYRYSDKAHYFHTYYYVINIILTLNSTRITNYIHYKEWDEKTCPFRNFQLCNDFLPCLTVHESVHRSTSKYKFSIIPSNLYVFALLYHWLS